MTQDTVEFGPIIPCPRCGALLPVDWPACMWCDHTVDASKRGPS